jgi:hypothetical protein
VHAHLTTEAHTCISNLKSDDDTVDFRGLTGEEKSVRKDTEWDLLCVCVASTLSRGSCNDESLLVAASPGDQMDVSGPTAWMIPLLAGVRGDPPLSTLRGGTRGKPEINQNGYFRMDVTFPFSWRNQPIRFVSSMIPSRMTSRWAVRPGGRAKLGYADISSSRNS